MTDFVTPEGGTRTRPSGVNWNGKEGRCEMYCGNLSDDDWRSICDCGEAERKLESGTPTRPLSALLGDLRRSLPPTPWARWEDGEPIGWRLSKSMWKAWLLPYRTAELLGVDDESAEMKLGPWRWNAPDVVRVFRDRERNSY